MSDNIVQLNTELIHSESKDLVKNSAEEALNAMLDAEADRLVNAERYARDEERQGYRAGHYGRSFTTTAGRSVLCPSRVIQALRALDGHSPDRCRGTKAIKHQNEFAQLLTGPFQFFLIPQRVDSHLT